MRKYFSRERTQYMFGVLSRPIDSFYEIRYRDKGSIPLAVICVLCLAVLFTVNRVFAGFTVNEVNPLMIDGIAEMSSFFVLLGLFCVGNWAVTCLMEGEGRMRDIITVAGYAMLPITLILGPATLISNFISIEEAAIYQILLIIGIAWTAVLLLIGIMTVHNYTLAKALITLLLTFLTVLILVFISVLVLDLLNQIYGFFYSIYTEIIFRF
ncbi:MAG: YIP1 family protein [Oscillospiraceae bacterium]|nr:YIP1 family protein [Oscillospiraceae bacterium]